MSKGGFWFLPSEMWTRWRAGDESGSWRNSVCFGENKLLRVCLSVSRVGAGRGKEGGQHDFLVNGLLVKTDRQAWKHFWEEKPHLQLHNPLSVKINLTFPFKAKTQEAFNNSDSSN